MKIAKYFNNLRFKHKLLIAFILISIVPMTCWGFFSIGRTNQFLAMQAEDNFDTLLINSARTIEEKLSKIENDIQFVARNETIVNVLSRQYSNPYGKYEAIVLRLDPLIHVLKTFNPEIKALNFYASGNIQGARKNLRAIEDIPEEYMALSNPVDVNWVNTEEDIIAVQQLMDVSTLEKQGLIEISINKDDFFGRVFSQHPANYQCSIYNLEGNTLYQNYSDEKTEDSSQLIRTAVLTTNGWTVEMRVDKSDFLPPSGQMFTSLFFFIGISFFMVLAMMVLFARLINRRMTDLNERLSGIVQSEFRIDISSPYSDEIGEITNNVGAMVRESRQMIDEVYESKIIQREAEMKALQSQINPHFLYNTLSAVNWAAIRAGNMELSRIVTGLSTFYRNTLNKGSNIVTIGEELDNTRAYLDLKLSINKNAFDVTFDIDQLILEYHMPNIILQPIVENAIDHGLAQKTKGRGNLFIQALEEKDGIVFVIQDNGIGMTPQMAEVLTTQDSKGYGVKNVSDRLRLFFGERGSLRFESSINGGTIAEIRIPKHIHREEEQEA